MKIVSIFLSVQKMDIILLWFLLAEFCSTAGESSALDWEVPTSVVETGCGAKVYSQNQRTT